MNADATEHDDDWVMTPVTESGTDRAPGCALHTVEHTAATEQLEHTVISTTADVSVRAKSAIDVNERAMTPKQEIHVEFNNGMWWVMPDDLSERILNEQRNGAVQVSFVWDWEDCRTGSYQFDGQKTSLSRYIIDFRTMQQVNTDNNRTRRVKVVSILRST